MRAVVEVAGRPVGEGHGVFVVAELGINHNGSLDLARRLIDAACLAGVDAVKFQKRTPELCVPREQWPIERDTPWGRMTYIDYRRRVEFGQESVDFLERFDPPCYKAASASLTDLGLLRRMRATGRPLMLSTGMSTAAEIDRAVAALGRERLLVAHATSTYPCPLGEVNLRMIETLRQRFPECPIGYSGHETGLAPTWAAVALGATFVERHVTLDRAMWGSDQAASVEIGGLVRLVSNIRAIETALGDGVKRVYAGELGPRARLRRVPAAEEECVAPSLATHATA